MTRKTLTAATLMLAMAGTVPAFAHGGREGGGCGHGHGLFMGSGLRSLDLSDDQKQQMHGIFTAHREKLHQLATNERAARQAISDRLHTPGALSQQDVDALVQQEVQARTDLMRERMAAALQARNVLSADQLQKAATLRAQMKQLHGQMRQLLGKSGDS
jgi:Spy/CpxP family protein refolding chaperone